MFEGIDGSGKTTQAKLFADWITSQGRTVKQVREPGTTEVGLKIREILLHRKSINIVPETEMFLFTAARVQLVHEVLLPALAAGDVIVCDRFFLSTIVYQGFAGDIDEQRVEAITSMAIQRMMPHWTVLLDIDPSVAAARKGEQVDRIEGKGMSFQEMVRDGYLEYADKLARIVESYKDTDTPLKEDLTVFDADQSEQALHLEIVKKFQELNILNGQGDADGRS